LDDLSFDIVDKVGYGIVDPTAKQWAVLPRKDKIEAQFLLHEYLLTKEYKTPTHDVSLKYTIYEDASGFKYQVYDDLGLVLTYDN